MNREDAIHAIVNNQSKTREQAEAFLDLLGSALRRRDWVEGEPLSQEKIAERFDRFVGRAAHPWRYPVSDVVKVTVKSGLTFPCPYCQSVGHRAAPGTDVFTAPPSHEVIGRGQQVVVRCFVRRQFGRDWMLEFADAAGQPTGETP